MDPEPGPQWPVPRSELARRKKVSPSTITRALAAAQARHEADPNYPPPPAPVNPGEPILLYPWPEFDRWWPTRPTVGRPPRPHTDPNEEDSARTRQS